MIDAITKQPLKVHPGSGPEMPYNLQHGPYLDVPLDQLPEVQAALERHGVTHWAGGVPITLDDEPPMITVYFGRRGDTATIQKALDSVP